CPGCRGSGEIELPDLPWPISSCCSPSSVSPILNFPYAPVNEASARLVAEQDKAVKGQRVIRQRHRLRGVPVAECHFQQHSGGSGVFFVYGFENRLYIEQFPRAGGQLLLVAERAVAAPQPADAGHLVAAVVVADAQARALHRVAALGRAAAQPRLHRRHARRLRWQPRRLRCRPPNSFLSALTRRSQSASPSGATKQQTLPLDLAAFCCWRLPRRPCERPTKVRHLSAALHSSCGSCFGFFVSCGDDGGGGGGGGGGFWSS
uniref:Tub domain-containing protein n=1 Tax=Macrostomum lignano TaxID=282301 RepID=A0A1I8FLQ7_9PLAT